MEDKKLKKEVLNETVVQETTEEIKGTVVEETTEVIKDPIGDLEVSKPTVEETEEPDLVEPDLVEPELAEATKVLLDITFDGNDILLMLDALKEYAVFLTENKRRANSIVIDESFNKKTDAKIKRTDELRFLIKKKLLIVDKAQEVYSVEDDGEVIGIETFEATEEGRVVKVAKPETIGSTPETYSKEKKEKVKTLVQTVSEEL